MIQIAKRNGNMIDKYEFEDMNKFKKNKWVSWSGIYINDINLEKSYINEVYCEKICGNCYNFGCSWDIRCNKNDEPINQVVYECPKFKNAIRLAKELKEKIESDKDFMEFCKIVNGNKKHGKESELEIYLAIFKKYM